MFFCFVFSAVARLNKLEKKNHSDHFPMELKSKETRFRVSLDFNSIGKWSE